MVGGSWGGQEVPTHPPLTPRGVAGAHSHTALLGDTAQAAVGGSHQRWGVFNLWGHGAPPMGAHPPPMGAPPLPMGDSPLHWSPPHPWVLLFTHGCPPHPWVPPHHQWMLPFTQLCLPMGPPHEYLPSLPMGACTHPHGAQAAPPEAPAGAGAHHGGHRGHHHGQSPGQVLLGLPRTMSGWGSGCCWGWSAPTPPTPVLAPTRCRRRSRSSTGCRRVRRPRASACPEPCSVGSSWASSSWRVATSGGDTRVRGHTSHGDTQPLRTPKTLGTSQPMGSPG